MRCAVDRHHLHGDDAGVRRAGRIFRTMGLGLKDLRVWQEAVALGADVIRAMRQTNRREIKAITEHTMVSAMLMAQHVAEGYGRYAAGEQRQLYRAAKRELLRLETALAIARQADLLSVTSHAQLSNRLQTVNRLLSGFLVYLDRQLSPAEASIAAERPR
ncbi:MAG TPA: four helix bundle protein [Gemmatimonadaceae bacterium]|nr:four helix bundle protein [Gemmatimonadaceae bacterium]